MFRYLTLAFATLVLAFAASGQDFFDEENKAVVAAREAYEASKKRRPKDDDEIAVAALNYGTSLLRVFAFKDSRRMLKFALKRYEKIYGKNAAENIPVLILLAQADMSLSTLRPNKSYLSKARKIALDKLDNHSIDYADQRLAIGQLLLIDPPPEEAGEDIHAALQVYVERLESNAVRIGVAEFALGRYYLGRNKYDDAVPHLESALEIFDSGEETYLNWFSGIHTTWAGWLESNGKRKDAAAHYVAVGRAYNVSDSQDLLPIVRVAPVYPSSALSAGISGYVDWQFTVDKNGFVVDPEVVHIQGSDAFVEASRRAIMKFRYPPRFIDGKAVATPGVTTHITFELRD